MNTAEITPKIAAMMNACDRKAMGILTPDERRAKAEGMAERDLQRLCEMELSRRGIWFLHLSFRAREKIGTPDILCVIAGRPLAIELKTTTGKLSEAQAWTLGRMQDNGWNCHVCRSFERFVEIITAENS